jgi:hypothetical protein
MWRDIHNNPGGCLEIFDMLKKMLKGEAASVSSSRGCQHGTVKFF